MRRVLCSVVVLVSVGSISGCATYHGRMPSAEPGSPAPAAQSAGTQTLSKNLLRVQKRIEAWESAEPESLRERCREGKLWKRYGTMTACRHELQEGDRRELEWVKLELALAHELFEQSKAHLSDTAAAPSEETKTSPVVEEKKPIAPVIAPVMAPVVAPLAPSAPIVVQPAPTAPEVATKPAEVKSIEPAKPADTKAIESNGATLQK